MTRAWVQLMVTQSLLATKNWAGPVKFDPGQEKISKYNKIYKEGNLNFLNIIVRLSENFTLKHREWSSVNRLMCWWN